MYAIEFESNIDNGFVKIPSSYLNKLAGKVKIIIFQKEPETNYIDELLESPFKVGDFTPFTRERNL